MKNSNFFLTWPQEYNIKEPLVNKWFVGGPKIPEADGALVRLEHSY